ncbi:MAG: NAD-dependent epimerase/dehydratase family protein [Methylophagaceae bacterium]
MNSLANKRCIVLGAGGFIGTNLCRSLIGKVDTLRAFGRRQSFPEVLVDKSIEWIPGDFSEPSTVSAAISGCDIVFHLVTSTTPASSNVNKINDIQSNVIATLNLLDACKEEGVERVVFVSSGGTVYGIPECIPTPENALLNPISAYGVSKLTIEKYLALYEHLYGLEYRVLRVSNPYGKYQTALRNQGVIAAFLRKALERKPIDIWGDGSIIRDYIYVDDVIRAFESVAVHDGKQRVFNIGSGEGKSINTIINAINDLTGNELDIRYSEGRSVDVPHSVLDISLARSDLAWMPQTDFLEGLQRTMDWLKTN